MQKLVIQDDEGKTTVVPLIKDEITVGRKEGNTIRLTERNVSRKHARILRSNGTIEIEDLDSYNGVKVNGSRIQGRIGLNPSDRVQIGDYLIELKADGAPMPGSTGVEDQPTRPIPQAGMSASAIPVVPESIEDAPTTKVPSGITFPGMTTGGVTADPLANTDPGRPAVTPATEPIAVAEPASSNGRLVILSDAFAGQEFDLSRPSMVIGRTDDNDVVINHRSISRHHSKIVRESGRYAIIDLQSSNGVRVNGEEYGRVELRRGDVIDLGHVRLRFIEPGEDFVFGRDAQAVPIPSGGHRGFLYGIIAVVVIAAIGIFALTRGGDGKEKNGVTPDNVAVGDNDNDPEGNDVKPDDPPKKATAEQIKPLLDGAQTAISEENWKGAIGKAKEALKLDPGNETANQRLEKAEFEQSNQELFEKFESAVEANDYAEVAQNFKAIKDRSIYKDRARDAHDRLRGEYVKKQEEKAKKLAADKKCSAITALINQTEATFEGSTGSLQQQATRCQKLAQNTRPSGNGGRNNGGSNNGGSNNGGSNGGSNNGGDPTPPPPDPKPKKSHDELIADVKKSISNGYYAQALANCRLAYDLKRNDQTTIQFCGLAACKAKKVKQAKRFYNRGNASTKKIILKTCLQEGGNDLRL